MDLARFPKNPEKEVFTVKADGVYLAVINGEDDIYVLPELFSSPLIASNKARALKKQHKIEVSFKKSSKQTKEVTVKQNCVLYSDAEVAKLTHLRFKEAWLILSPNGHFVEQVLNKNSVVKYTKKVSDAKIFKSYEDATSFIKTLDMVVKKGHGLRRYYIRSDSDQVS
jgi:hypothetical protein